MSEWKPIELAKKDGTPYLLKLKHPLPPPHMAEVYGWVPERFQFPDGFIFVGLNNFHTWAKASAKASDKDRVGWTFAAPIYIGQGGFPDDWFVGFQELPQ